jgi:2-polyprenyl-3-methyl-5-hydroxy-6-metoxy-1,4-benzoquinol methylase
VIQTYVFDNAWRQERRRLDALETIWDPWTIRNLNDLGVSEGWRCAEIGAGGGSIAAWLSRRLGPSGSVLATDLDTTLLETIQGDNVAVRCHDITIDALEPGAFDLVHTRLLLEHLPRHQGALQHMYAALKPGGWLLIEEFDHTTFLPDPDCSPEASAVWQAWLAAFENLAAARSLDLTYGAGLFGLLSRLGLENVAAEGSTVAERGGSDDRALLLLSILKLRDDLVATGEIDDSGVDRLLELLQDPAFFWTSQVMVTARGQRPTL